MAFLVLSELDKNFQPLVPTLAQAAAGQKVDQNNFCLVEADIAPEAH